MASAFGDVGVSIRSVWQEGVDAEASLIVVTHRAVEGDQRRAVELIAGLDEVVEVASVIRVLGDACREPAHSDVAWGHSRSTAIGCPSLRGHRS